MCRGAGVTAPATARPFGRISPSRSPTMTGAVRRASQERRELELPETGAQTDSEETGPCPTHRDYSRAARDSGSLGAGWSPMGDPELAGAFLGASPGSESCFSRRREARARCYQ